MTTMTNRRTYRKLALSKGERSSAGRASVCGSESPHPASASESV